MGHPYVKGSGMQWSFGGLARTASHFASLNVGAKCEYNPHLKVCLMNCSECSDPGILRANGKCRSCHGMGKIGTIADDVAGGKQSCSRCNGSGRCPRCGGTGLTLAVPPAPRPLARAELNPFDDKIAVRVSCPNCGDLDWFEWKFMGKLTDPVCGHTWYVDSALYTGQQFRAVFKAAGRSSKYMTAGLRISNGAAVAKIAGWATGVTFGIAFRLPCAAIMIPLQAIVRTSSSRKLRTQAPNVQIAEVGIEQSGSKRKSSIDTPKSAQSNPGGEGPPMGHV